MKKSDKNSLRGKTVDALKADAAAIRDALLKARLGAATKGNARLGMSYRAQRRQLARLETIITEKAAAAATAK